MYSAHIEKIKVFLVTVISMLCAYFESTQSFMIALLLGFFFNILAGFKADDVKFKMWRLCNFSGHKFKDSLIELLLIILITYFLKSMVDLMHQEDKSAYIVECLVWIAIYNYVRNGLRNLSKGYPNNRWIRFVSNLLMFNFKALAPDSVQKAWEKSKEKNAEE